MEKKEFSDLFNNIEIINIVDCLVKNGKKLWISFNNYYNNLCKLYDLVNNIDNIPKEDIKMLQKFIERHIQYRCIDFSNHFVYIYRDIVGKILKISRSFDIS